MSYLTRRQVEYLGKAIQENRVQTRDNLSHLEAFDVRGHLNRMFGFARWSADLTDLACLYEQPNQDSSRYSVGYRATVRLAVCAPDGTQLATYTEAATGDATNFPASKRADAHDFAIKTAESQALKRCAVNLGDQFGLSLYNKGSKAAFVRWTLVLPEQEGAAPANEQDTEKVPDVHPESEQVDPAPDSHTQSQPPRQETNSDAKTLRVNELRDALLAAKSRSAASAIAISVGKDGLRTALTDDGQGNVITLGALLDATLKRVTKAS